MSEYNAEEVEDAVRTCVKEFEALCITDGADVVEVVRCKDCKWWIKQEDSLQGRCALMQNYPTGAWYCANGERKDGEEE